MYLTFDDLALTEEAGNLEWVVELATWGQEVNI